MIKLEKGHDGKVVLFFCRKTERYLMDGSGYPIFGWKGYKINGAHHPGHL